MVKLFHVVGRCQPTTTTMVINAAQTIMKNRENLTTKKQLRVHRYNKRIVVVEKQTNDINRKKTKKTTNDGVDEIQLKATMYDCT